MKIAVIISGFAILQFASSYLAGQLAQMGTGYLDLLALTVPIGVAAFLCTFYLSRRAGVGLNLWKLLASCLIGMMIGAAGQLLMWTARKGIPVGSGEFTMTRLVIIIRLVISILAMLLGAGAARVDWKKAYGIVNKWHSPRSA